MKHKYIEFIRKEYDSTNAFILQILLDNGLVDELQTILNAMGENLVVDGILGFKTLYALSKHNITTVYKELDKLLTSGKVKEKIDNEDDIKAVVMNFLATWESTKVHYNKGEYSFTTPYGVYAYANPNAEIVKYVKTLYRKYGFNPNIRAHAKALNSKITAEEKLKIKEMAWDFYKSTYMHPKVKEILITARWKKSFLTYVSNSINGGLKRGAKALQSSLGTNIDGVIGKQTLILLKTFIKEDTDKHLNDGMLDYMVSYYKELAYSKAKFKRFLKGWLNRIAALR